MHGDGNQDARDAEQDGAGAPPMAPPVVTEEGEAAGEASVEAAGDSAVAAESAESAESQGGEPVAAEAGEAAEAAADAAAAADGEQPATGTAEPTDIRSKNLAELETLCADLERVVTIAEVKLKTLEKRLNQADNKFPRLLPLPGHAKKQTTDRFQEARKKLVVRIGELKEAEEWKRWANVPKMEGLITFLEHVIDHEQSLKLVDVLKKSQEEWKELGPAPADKAQDLWNRFKAASDKVYDKIKELRAVQDVEFQGNLEKKKALCEQAEALSDSNDWAGTADALKRLQAEWKAIGPVPRKQADAIWKRFRTACDAFFERRRPHLERAIGEKQANLDRKRAIVEFVEKLAEEATDLEDAAAKVADARRDWKRTGQVPHREFEQLSDRLNKASDKVFARRDEAREARAAEARAAIETPVTEAEAMLESLAGGGEVDQADLAQRTIKARAALRELEQKGAGGLAGPMRGRVEALTRRAVELAPAAFKGSDLDPDQTRKRKEKLVAKIEELAPTPAGAAEGGPLNPADIAAKLKAALADRALGGVLSKQAKGRANKDVVADARDSWSRLGPVPGPEGDALEKRFADACRRAVGG